MIGAVGLDAVLVGNDLPELSSQINNMKQMNNSRLFSFVANSRLMFVHDTIVAFDNRKGEEGKGGTRLAPLIVRSKREN